MIQILYYELNRNILDTASDKLKTQILEDIPNILIDGSLSLKEVLSICLSVLAGKSTVSGSTVKFRDIADTKDRVSATMSGATRVSTTVNGS